MLLIGKINYMYRQWMFPAHSHFLTCSPSVIERVYLPTYYRLPTTESSGRNKDCGWKKALIL